MTPGAHARWRMQAAALVVSAASMVVYCVFVAADVTQAAWAVLVVVVAVAVPIPFARARRWFLVIETVLCTLLGVLAAVLLVVGSVALLVPFLAVAVVLARAAFDRTSERSRRQEPIRQP